MDDTFVGASPPAPPQDPARPAALVPPDVWATKYRIGAFVVGLGALGAGGTAVYRTSNELGASTLMAAGVYFLLAAIIQRFPKLKFGDNEIDPNQVAAARQESTEAKADSGEAKEGLADVLDRIAKLEAVLASGDRSTVPRGVAVQQPDIPVPLPSPTDGIPTDLDPRLEALAAEYNKVRWTMPSGPPRTARMTKIVTNMIDVCRQVDVPEIHALLTSDDRGLRLVAVAALNARPDASHIAQLVEVCVAEDKPFNEYWALQTLRRNLDGYCDALTPTLRLELQNRMNALPPGVDRWHLIQSILTITCP